MSDYEIDEIRRIRRKISAEHNDDIKQLGNYYQQLEQEIIKSGKYKFSDKASIVSEQQQVEITAS